MVKEAPVYIVKLLILFLITVGSLNAKDVTVRISQTAVPKGQSVEVSITARGKNIVFPQITEIGGIPVDTPTISQKIEATYANGAFRSVQKKTLHFSFFPEHNMTIPSFAVTVDGRTEHTRPVSIRVTRRNSASRAGGGYRLEMIPSKTRLYVGEPFVLQVVFYEPRNSQVTQAQYVAPKFDGFFVKTDNQETLKQDARGTAHIFTYLLTPQKEGNLTITAPQIKLGIRTFSGARDPWGFFNNDVQWQSLQAEPKTVTALSIPASANLIGSFTMNASVDTHQTHANQPVNYTLTLEGVGSLEDFDAPKFDIDDVTVYSDDAQISSRIQDGKIISRWVKKYTFIADHNFTIPAIARIQFNPETEKTKTLSVQPVAIHIAGGSQISSPASSKPLPAAESVRPSAPETTHAFQKASRVQKDANRSLLEDTAYYARQAREKASARWPAWTVLLAFVTGVLVTLLVLKLLPHLNLSRPGHRRTRKRYTPDEALKLLYPHTNDSPEIEAMVRDLYRAQRGEKVEIDQERLQKIMGRATTD